MAWGRAADRRNPTFTRGLRGLPGHLFPGQKPLLKFPPAFLWLLLAFRFTISWAAPFTIGIFLRLCPNLSPHNFCSHTQMHLLETPSPVCWALKLRKKKPNLTQLLRNS